MAGEALNLDARSVMLGPCDAIDGQIVFAGADTLTAGTLLAQDTSGGSNKVALFVIYDDNGTPPTNTVHAVLAEDLVATGAGTLACRPIVRGTVNLDKLKIDDGGTITPAILEQLRDKGILAKPASELGAYDNALA